jgi:hypothetical protein
MERTIQLLKLTATHIDFWNYHGNERVIQELTAHMERQDYEALTEAIKTSAELILNNNLT